jgi:hypothetical protein
VRKTGWKRKRRPQATASFLASNVEVYIYRYIYRYLYRYIYWTMYFFQERYSLTAALVVSFAGKKYFTAWPHS